MKKKRQTGAQVCSRKATVLRPTLSACCEQTHYQKQHAQTPHHQPPPPPPLPPTPPPSTPTKPRRGGLNLHGKQKVPSPLPAIRGGANLDADTATGAEMPCRVAKGDAASLAREGCTEAVRVTGLPPTRQAPAARRGDTSSATPLLCSVCPGYLTDGARYALVCM